MWRWLVAGGADNVHIFTPHQSETTTDSMNCEPTHTPAPEEIDIPAIREKYRRERDMRLRREGQKQYVETEEDFAAGYETDPHMPIRPRDPIFEDLDVAILGGGFSGIMAGVHLRNAGVENFRHIEHAGDFGGVWYWNRYPGIQGDNDAYCYLALLEDEAALFHTLISALRWDEEGL